MWLIWPFFAWGVLMAICYGMGYSLLGMVNEPMCLFNIVNWMASNFKYNLYLTQVGCAPRRILPTLYAAVASECIMQASHLIDHAAAERCCLTGLSKGQVLYERCNLHCVLLAENHGQP
jgi:hypothetical protein